MKEPIAPSRRLNGREVKGRALTVNEARPREEKDFDSSRGDRGRYGRRQQLWRNEPHNARS